MPVRFRECRRRRFVRQSRECRRKQTSSELENWAPAVNERRGGTVVAVRAYLCRWTSFPFYDGLLWLHSTDDRKGDGFFLFQTITGAQVRFFFFRTLTTLFLTFFPTFTIRPTIPSLFHRPTGHESRRFNVRVGLTSLAGLFREKFP